ncbi:MAG: hypothetical protein NZT92_23335, partial [Abditibacteriales bacterium]|nr:hypothetical protein [Abditibacteriales bacterium]
FIHNNSSVNVLFLNGKARSFTLQEWQARGWAVHRRSTGGGPMGMGGWQWSTTPDAPSVPPPAGGGIGEMPSAPPPLSGGDMP